MASQQTFLASVFETRTADTTVPLDPKLLDDLELLATDVSRDLDLHLSALREHMKRISLHTYQAVYVHEKGVDDLCAATEKASQAALEMIKRVDELSHDLSGVLILAEQVQNIKEALDWLESVVLHTSNSSAPIPSSLTQIVTGVFGSNSR
ncbi:hypothetical protein HK096_004921 [Nowakowskiella sp. JEL0078]|nr:hypothetical protein HK096_004921 [Nowakowskiella sp. JEL0078]